jgi:predicted ester cyclase
MEMMVTNDISETAKAVVRRNTIEVQGGGNWELFDELFADDFHDHTPQPGGKPDKAGVLELYRRLREAFPDFTPEIHWQKADGDVVTTYKTYHGTHLGNFLGVPGTGLAPQQYRRYRDRVHAVTQRRRIPRRQPSDGCADVVAGANTWRPVQRWSS